MRKRQETKREKCFAVLCGLNGGCYYSSEPNTKMKKTARAHKMSQREQHRTPTAHSTNNNDKARVERERKTKQ